MGPAADAGKGRRGRRALPGGCDAVGPAIIPRRAGVEPRTYGGWRNVIRLKEKTPPSGAFFILQAFYLIDKPLAGMMGPSASEAVRLILSPGFRMAASGLSEALML